MKIEYELFNEGLHYEFVKKWWLSSGWDPVDKDYLSPVGYITYVDEVPVSAGWLYMAVGARIAMVEYIVGNPLVRKAPRSAGINALIDILKTHAKQVGVEKIFMTTKNQVLISRLKNQGFKAEENMTGLFANI